MASGLSSMAHLTKSFLGLLFLMMMQPFTSNKAKDFAGNRDDEGILDAPAKYEKGGNSNVDKASAKGHGEGNGDGNAKDKGFGKCKEVKEDDDDGDAMDVDDGDHHHAYDDENGGDDVAYQYIKSSSDDDDSDDDDDDFDIHDDFSDIEAELEAMRRQDGKVKEF